MYYFFALRYSPLRTRAYYSQAAFMVLRGEKWTMIEVVWGWHEVSKPSLPAFIGFLKQDFATNNFLKILRWRQFHTLTENSSPPVIELEFHDIWVDKTMLETVWTWSHMQIGRSVSTEGRVSGIIFNSQLI